MATAPMSDTLRSEVSATAKEAARSASAKLDEKKDSAASGIEGFAQALRKAGSEGDGAGRFADMAADCLQDVSQSLRNKNLNTLVADAESLARRQPVVFFGAAMVAGFVALRFLKSSRRPAEGESASASDTQPVTDSRSL